MGNNYIITIGREYGSGGCEIGKKLAEKLGIGFYDKNLIDAAAEKSGIHIDMLHKADEKPANPLTNPFLHPGYEAGTINDRLFWTQSEVIRELAEKESCVIIGRCADYVLKDYPNVLSVFIHAPKEYCLEGAAKKHSMSPKELERFINKTDKHRAEYYKYHTGREWTDARNYDLCLDSSKLGYERCVDEIISYMKVRFPED